MKRFGVIGLCVLASCQTTPKIAAEGPNLFIVMATNDACGTCDPAEVRAANAAQAYCKAEGGKTATVVGNETRKFDMGFGYRVKLTFSCEVP